MEILKIGGIGNRKFENMENRKVGKMENLKIGNLEIVKSEIRRVVNSKNRKIENFEIRKSLVLRVRWLVLHLLATPENTLALFSGCIDGRMDGWDCV